VVLRDRAPLLEGGRLVFAGQSRKSSNVVHDADWNRWWAATERQEFQKPRQRRACREAGPLRHPGSCLPPRALRRGNRSRSVRLGLRPVAEFGTTSTREQPKSRREKMRRWVSRERDGMQIFPCGPVSSEEPDPATGGLGVHGRA